jgi:hypothetical protein
MRIQTALPAIMVASLLGSTLMAIAQTGEFATQVPGSVVHEGWELQDRLQDARSEKRASRAAQSYGNSNSVKPAAGVATRNGTKAER